MERHEIMELLGQLKLAGMRAAYDEVVFVLNILARQRDPAPPRSVATPAALTLAIEPAADCARYDRATGAVGVLSLRLDSP